MSSVAARVAPELDRLRLGIAKAVRPYVAAIATTYGIGEHGGYLLAMLRHTMPDRVVDREAVAAIFLYGQRERFEFGLGEILRAGLVEEVSGDRLALTSTGRAALERYHAAGAEVCAPLWRGHEALTTQLSALTARGLAATTDGGPTFSVLWPTYNPPGASDAAQLAEHLTALRFHRFDAHVAAWQAAGLTVEQVMALHENDPRHTQIEGDTNRRAFAPYSVLTEDEGETLVNGLAALPSTFAS